jgi:molybdopterin synthase catalytic subunit
MMNEYLLSLLPVADRTEVLTDEPINLALAIGKCQDPKAGAVVLFSGEVRNHSHHKEVLYLEYEAYRSMAEAMIIEIVNEAKKEFKLHQALCIHRTGKVDIGESAVVVITASSHREQAYAANRYIIDRVKHEAPIWKKEYFADASYEWGHNCSCFNHQK